MTRRDALTAAAAIAASTAAPADASATAADDHAATLKLLDDFAAAWNRHDVDALMACMTSDCVFEASAGAQQAPTVDFGTNNAG